MKKYIWFLLFTVACQAGDVSTTGGCLIFQLRTGRAPSPNIDAMLKAVPQVDYANRKSFQDLYSWAIPVLGFSFEETEKHLPNPAEYNNYSIDFLSREPAEHFHQCR
jgi:hypothetical protein